MQCAIVNNQDISENKVYYCEPLINKAKSGDIPGKLIKESEFISFYLVNCINEAIINWELPQPLKLSNTVLVCLFIYLIHCFKSKIYT